MIAVLINRTNAGFDVHETVRITHSGFHRGFPRTRGDRPRLILKVASEAGSNLALGMRGAERLLGKGHLAARLAGDKPSGEEYFTAQVPFGSTAELALCADAINSAAKFDK